MSRACKTFAAIVTSLFLAAIPISGQAQPFKSNEITIRHDRGGQVLKYVTRLEAAARRGANIRFAGHCQSACTLYLAMPRSKTCIAPGASFSFHLPYGASVRVNAIAANFMMRRYPDWVRNWIKRNGGLTNRMKRMDYAYASRFIGKCHLEPARA